jgi:zinc finger protein
MPDELQDEEEAKSQNLLTAPQNNFTYEDLLSEVFQLPTNCPSCNVPCNVNTKVTSKLSYPLNEKLGKYQYCRITFFISEIPYFKEVLIMASNCDNCGYRTNEVKSGGGIEPEGIRIEVTVSDEADLSRDILKVC